MNSIICTTPFYVIDFNTLEITNVAACNPLVGYGYQDDKYNIYMYYEYDQDLDYIFFPCHYHDDYLTYEA